VAAVRRTVFDRIRGCRCRVVHPRRNRKTNTSGAKFIAKYIHVKIYFTTYLLFVAPARWDNIPVRLDARKPYIFLKQFSKMIKKIIKFLKQR
jgi:hypothetical protein